MSKVFAFDNSGSISGNKLYFKEIDRLVKKHSKKPGNIFYLWGSHVTEKSKTEIEDWIKKMNGPEGTDSSLIAETVNKCPTHREHLIIVTDDEVDEYDIKESDKLMKKYNIQFKCVSVYVIGDDGNLLVGAPYCRGCPNKTVHVFEENGVIKRERGASLSLEEIKAYENISSISTYNQFNTEYKKLESVIKSKQLGKNCDNEMKSNLEALKNRIINSINGNEKNDFEEKWKILYDWSVNGVHDYSFGQAA